jgi:hypothetical protein
MNLEARDSEGVRHIWTQRTPCSHRGQLRLRQDNREVAFESASVAIRVQSSKLPSARHKSSDERLATDSSIACDI